MKKEFLLLPLMACCAVAHAYGASYTNVFSGVTKSGDDYVLTAPTGGSWSQTATVADIVSISNGTAGVYFETEEGSNLTFTVSAEPADTNTIAKIEIEATLADVGELASLSGDDPAPQTAFAVTNGCYCAWNGSEWLVLGTFDASAVSDEAATNLTVEISYQGTNGYAKARFTVGETVLVNEAGSVTDADGWMTLGTSTATTGNMSSIACTGSGLIKSLKGSVMLGVASIDGYKYGTLTDALTAATNSSNAVTVELLADCDGEDVDIGDSTNVTIADNGKSTGTITTSGTITVAPTVEEITNHVQNVGKSGTYTLSVKATATTYNVTLPAEITNKTIVDGSVSNANGYVTFDIETAASVLTGATVDSRTFGGTDAKLTALREYLAAYTNEAYIAADVSSTTIKEALEASRENGLPLYQSYALGISPETSVKPVGKVGDETSDKITLTIPGLKGTAGSRPGEYTSIKVKVGDGEGVDPSSNDITIPTTTGTYKVTIVFED